MIATNHVDMDSRFDFWDMSFSERIRRCSIPTEVDYQDRENLRILTGVYSIQGYKPEPRILDSHIQYLERVMLKLLKKRQEEAEVFPHNPEVDSTIARIRGLMHKLMEAA